MPTLKQYYSLHRQVLRHYAAFADRFGIGPCGAVTAALRRLGYGEVMVCEAREIGRSQQTDWFAHYVLVSPPGRRIDLGHPFRLEYRDCQMLDAGEMPDLVDEETIAWWLDRLW